MLLIEVDIPTFKSENFDEEAKVIQLTGKKDLIDKKKLLGYD